MALLAAGILAWLNEVSRRIGALTILLGVLWFAPDWEGWVAHPLARSVGSVAFPFFLVVLFHLVLAAPRGRLRSRTAISAVGAAYAITTLLAV